MAKIESAVIVTNEHGSIATLRFDEPLLDRIISSSSKTTLYIKIEKYVKKVTNA